MSRLIGILVLSLFVAFSGPWARSEPAESKKVAQGPKPARTDIYGDAIPDAALIRLGTLRLRHGHVVNSLAFSADGKRLVSSASDHTIRVWDLATGKQLHVIGQELALANVYAPSRWITGVAISPDGKKLASGSNDGTVRIWETSTHQELLAYRDHQGGILSVAFSPDGKTVASTGLDNTARLWTSARGEASSVTQLQAKCSSIVFSGDGKTVAWGGADRNVWLQEIGKAEARKLEGHQQPVMSVAWSKDGTLLASGSQDGTVRLWHVAAGKEQLKLDAHTDARTRGVAGVGLTPDGKVLVSAGSADGLVRVWNAATGKEIRTIQANAGPVSAFALSPDGKTAAVGGDLGSIHLWDVESGKELHPFAAHPGMVEVLSYTSDGKTLVSASRDRTIRSWDAATGKQLGLFDGRQEKGLAIGLSGDGRVAATASSDGVIHIWERATGKEIRPIKGAAAGGAILALSADGTILAVGGAPPIRIFDVDTGQLRTGVQGHPGVRALALSPDCKVLAHANLNQQTIRFRNAVNGELLRDADEPAGLIDRLAFSPDGKLLASGGQDGVARIWDVATGKKLHQLSGHPGYILSLAFSPDGRTLAVGSWMTLRLWEVASGKDRGNFLGHQGDVMSLVFAPNGRTLASGCSDSTILVWDLTGRLKDGRLETAELSAQELKDLWSDLAQEDSAKAYRAVWTLAAGSKESVRFLKGHLRSAPAVDSKRIDKLIAQLDDDSSEVREKASSELAKLGNSAEPALRAALKKDSVTPEMRLRIEVLLSRLEGPSASPVVLRMIRAIEVLEQIGSDEAVQVLEALAKENPPSKLSEGAKQSLLRLKKRK